MNLKNNNILGLLFLGMFYAGLQILAPLLGNFVIKFGWFALGAGGLASMLGYVVMGAIHEIYPKKYGKSVLNFAFVIRPLMFMIVWLILMLPVIKNLEQQNAIQQVFNGSVWLVFVGVCTNWFGQRINLQTHKSIAVKTKGKIFPLRSYLGTVIGGVTGSVSHTLLGYGLGAMLGFLPYYPILPLILGGLGMRLSFMLFINTPLTTLLVYIMSKFGYVTLKDVKGIEED